MARLPKQNMKPGIPAKPPGMSKAAAAEWDSIARDIQDSNISVTKMHGRLIELAAKIAVDIEAAAKKVDADGPYYLNKNTGAVMLHPATRRLDSLRRDYAKVLSALGLRTAMAGALGKGNSLDELMDD